MRDLKSDVKRRKFCERKGLFLPASGFSVLENKGAVRLVKCVILLAEVLTGMNVAAETIFPDFL